MNLSKNAQFFILFIANSLYMTTYIIPAAFYSISATRRGISISIIGVILGFFAIGSLFISFFLPALIIKFSKRSLIFFWNFILVISFTCFSLLDYIESNNFFIMISIILRILQGISVGILTTLIYSHIPFLYSEKSQMRSKISLMEFSSGIGVSTGPSIGGLLHYFFANKGIYIFFGGFQLIITLFFLLIKFEDNDKKLPTEKKITNREIPEIYDINNLAMKKKKDSLIILMFSPMFILSYLFMIMTFVIYLTPFLFFTVHIKKNFNVSTSTNSLIMSIFAIQSPIIALIYSLPKWKIHPAVHIFIGFFLEIIGNILIGPMVLLGVPNKLGIIILGEIIVGTGLTFALNPQFNFILEILKEILRKFDLEEETLNNMASIYYVNVWNIGELISLFLGGFLIDYFGYSNAINLLGTLTFFIFLLLLIFGKGFRHIRNPYQYSTDLIEKKLLP